MAITTLVSDNHLPEDVHCRPKHIGSVSHTYELLSFHCCALVGINIVKPQLSTEHTAESLPSCGCAYIVDRPFDNIHFFVSLMTPSTDKVTCCRMSGWLVKRFNELQEMCKDKPAQTCSLDLHITSSQSVFVHVLV